MKKSSTKSAPLVRASHNSGERDPAVMPDSGGADTYSLGRAIDALVQIRDIYWLDGMPQSEKVIDLKEIAADALREIEERGSTLPNGMRGVGS